MAWMEPSQEVGNKLREVGHLWRIGCFCRITCQRLLSPLIRQGPRPLVLVPGCKWRNIASGAMDRCNLAGLKIPPVFFFPTAQPACCQHSLAAEFLHFSLAFLNLFLEKKLQERVHRDLGRRSTSPSGARRDRLADALLRCRTTKETDRDASGCPTVSPSDDVTLRLECCLKPCYSAIARTVGSSLSVSHHFVVSICSFESCAHT